METIEFEASFGNEKKKIRITQPAGAEGYQTTIDGFYQGMLMKKNGAWAGHLNDNSQLTADDIQILGDIIDSRMV